MRVATVDSTGQRLKQLDLLGRTTGSAEHSRSQSPTRAGAASAYVDQARKVILTPKSEVQGGASGLSTSPVDPRLDGTALGGPDGTVRTQKKRTRPSQSQRKGSWKGKGKGKQKVTYRHQRWW